MGSLVSQTFGAHIIRQIPVAEKQKVLTVIMLVGIEEKMVLMSVVIHAVVDLQGSIRSLFSYNFL
ncbi:hypothetical protein CA160_01315 [Vibrio parahaemolyticus]|nr:hypothetical protein BBL86_09900 [Vibrio parahaemolyticus]OXD47159.1 hypothetical protein CA160_01315 [Vibrio parahaemolyticus]OYR34159.1 hypothetical protein YB08_20520 [Vibrio parahaemolyticus]